MTADNFITPNERAVSGALALMMHGLFFALIVFGVTWQKREPPAMVVDLWNNLPPLAAPTAEAPPAPEVKPEPPPPPPKAEAKPVPRAEPAPVSKADIALKDKKDKERKAQEELAEKKKREQVQARVAEQKDQQAKAAEQQRLAREQDEALRKIAQQQAAAQEKLRNEYIEKIRSKIRSRITLPPNLQGNPEAELGIIVLPGGEVLGVKTRKASDQSAWDTAVERAILLAQPLPMPPPPDSPLFKEFRELNLKFRPKE